MDLLLCFRDEMKTRSTYDIVFEKVWGASGGWAVIMCPCGIVNSVKFNIRAESPRDYTDMLLSFKHFPNVVIYDFARGLVTHTNLREPERLPFSPHEGRLATATPENMSCAKNGKLRISLPWLQLKKCPPDLDGHPETGSADHYALYDTFHQFNTKDEKDSLRRIGVVPELCGWLNSQTVEQLFSGMRKNNYFLNSLSSSSHVFLMRNILHHRNERLNQQAIEGLKKAFNGNVILDSNGKAILTTSGSAATSASLPFSVSAAAGFSAATSASVAYSACAPGASPASAASSVSAAAGFSAATSASVASSAHEPGASPASAASSVSAAAGFSAATSAPGASSVSAGSSATTSAAQEYQGCGLYCEAVTQTCNLRPCRSCWTLGDHPEQQQLLDYVLHDKAPKHELIIKDGNTCLTRENFQTLGLRKDMDSEGLTQQTHANDCGIYMIMYTWYLILDAPFDFTVDDMPVLRRWWCAVLMENLHLEGHGRRFAHFTEEGKDMIHGLLSPVFRLKRKRKANEETNEPLQVDKNPWKNQWKTTATPKSLELSMKQS
ncbi:uncharacterized protein [Pagrus major]|uniref:uncharacterized protein isoform X2 n=1 Tax=Pagrus major TaxID=143350 RepID=UPI003CC8B7D0